MEADALFVSDIVKKNDYLLCLDFDGVICDSSRECFVSSWMAYQRLKGREGPGAVPIDFFRRFTEMRPFIRSGPDYVLIQKLLDEGRRVRDQRDFDRHIAGLGPAAMSSFGEAFYLARESLLARDRSYWISLNPLYRHVEAPLKARCRSPFLRIVSSKRPDFILEILTARGISFPAERIILADKTAKLDVVRSLLPRSGASRAFFVDDQIDHLRPNRDRNIFPVLAAWGYIKKDWLSNPRDILVCSGDAADRLFAGLPDQPSSSERR
jgi:hypothetical protein